MNQYTASLDGNQVGHMIDDPNLHTTVMQTVGIWLRAGFTVRIQGGTNLTTAPRPAPVQRAQTPRRRKTLARLPAKATPVELPIEELAGWNLGDRAYLAWSVLGETERVHLSQYRTTACVIERFRRLPGVQDAVAVRFNDDPELTWLLPSEITSVPEVG